MSAILDRYRCRAGAGAGRGNSVGLRQPGCQLDNWKCRAADRQETSISGSGSWSIFHFLGDNASSVGLLDTSMVSGMVAVNRRLDARSSVSVDADYATFSYSGSSTGLTPPDIETRGVNLSYQRLLSRTLSVNVSGGPQWVSSSNSTLIPSDVNAAVSAGLSYSRGLTSASIGYSRGVSAGSGVLLERVDRQCLCFPRAYLWPQVGRRSDCRVYAFLRPDSADRPAIPGCGKSKLRHHRMEESRSRADSRRISPVSPATKPSINRATMPLLSQTH